MKFSGRFKPNKWKWYIVDLRDWHKPVLVRKHLDTYNQARRFRKEYFDKNYSVVGGKRAIEMDIRDFINKKRRHGQILKASKYEYPSYIKTKQQKKIYRTQLGNRRRLGTQKLMVTKNVAWEIIEDKPMRFIKRLTLYNANHFPFSQPVEGVLRWKKEYEDIDDIRHLANIVRCLKGYYDLGDYRVEEVAEVIYKIWRKKIEKWCTGYKTNPTDMEQIEKEFIARGFIPKSEIDYDEDKDSFVQTIHIFPPLVYPMRAWHRFDERSRFKYNIYELQKNKGISGYTMAAVAGIKKRR